MKKDLNSTKKRAALWWAVWGALRGTMKRTGASLAPKTCLTGVPPVMFAEPRPGSAGHCNLPSAVCSSFFLDHFGLHAA